MANIINQYGQVKLGIRVPSSPLISSLWNSIYSVYNADAVGSSSLKTSLFAAYNGESNTNDSFGSNNGTPVGGLTYTTGKIGNAFQFNGSTAYVSIPNTSNQFNFDGDFSISTWVNTPNYTSSRIIFSNYSLGGTYGYGIMIYHANTNIFGCALYNGNTIGQYHTSAGITTNSWNHVVVVRKVGQNTKIYINGTLASGSYPLGNSSIAPSFPGTQIVNIGSYSNGSNLATYQQDATTIWNRELTASEITELYNSGNGAQYITDSFYKPTTSDALNTYNGTAQGGLTYGVGKVGTAFQFNGTTAYVQLGDVMDVGTSSWSYSMWFNVNSLNSGTYLVLFSKSLAAALTGRVWITTYGNKMQFNFDALTNVNIINTESTTTFNTNTWYHLVCVLDRNDKLKMYINGVQENLSTISGTNNLTPYSATNYNTNNPFRIGAYTASDNTTAIGFYSGKIDEFNVWNRVLTQSEITELYNSGNGKQYPN